MNLIKSLYIIAIGLLVTAFVGFGVETFYPSPKTPDYPTDIEYSKEGDLTEDSRKKQSDYDKSYKDFHKEVSKYNQNAAVILIVISIIILAASIIGLSKLEIIGDGLTLGGVFTLFYGIFRAVTTEEAVFRFVAVGIGLFIIIALTYWKFLKDQFPLNLRK
jgi:hypothetical protein